MEQITQAVIIHLFFVGIFANEELIVSLNDGLVQGSYKQSYNGRKFMSFEGIPYARPPIGNLRFEDPQPAEPWSGLLEAVKTYTCLQLDILQQLAGQEDCLYINVYVPRERINPDEKLDVIVHIHGGAFMSCSPTDFAGPDKIMDRDVVYVHFSYRLGPLGFYSLGDGRGNYGLKDQTAALKWVRDNIGKFGGNKDSVTINGMSAGGASVHLHYFSELSKGLFNRGFVQSGMALNSWVIRENPGIHGKKLAAEVGCSDQSVEDLYECMKKIPGQDIIHATKIFYHSVLVPLAPFGPVIEKDTPTSFLRKHPYTQLVNKEIINDLPMLVSMSAKEGTTTAVVVYGQVDDVNQNYKTWFPLMFEYYDYDQTKRDEISEKVRKFYFKDEPITTENFDNLIEACSHRLFHLGGEKSIRLQAKASQSDIYFFMVDYVGTFVPAPIKGFDIDFGAGHGMDGKFYWTGSLMHMEKLTEEEEKMKDILLDIMVSFAKTGIPKTDAVDFQRFSDAGDFNYLHVKGPDDLHMATASNLGPHEFWNSFGLKEDEIATIEITRNEL